MKSKIKISLAILAIASISAISATSIVSCSNNSSQNQNNSNASNSSTPSDTKNNWANGVSYTPYISLSTTKIIDNPSTKEPFTNYQTALANWTSTYNSLIKTNSQYEAAVKNALYSFLINNNNKDWSYSSYSKNSPHNQPTITVGSTNYYELYTGNVPYFQISFAANNYVNINCKYNSFTYLFNPNNSSQKYLIYETEYTYSVTANFAPCLVRLNWSYSTNNDDYYGGICFNNATENSATQIQLDNKALISANQLYYIKESSSSLNSEKLLQNIIASENQPMQSICTSKINITSPISIGQEGEVYFLNAAQTDGTQFIYTYLGSWNYGNLDENNTSTSYLQHNNL
ncbi:MAG: hypothetical protein IIT78_01635 [Mycoplasmataceae bacterium]|nr:hypothetical protein [Mycoplasmataceae bacterium]